jgi:antitoxin component HigA of HigAB toxin-antitoxin module
MRRLAKRNGDKLPTRFSELVRLFPPRAIADDTELDNMIELVHRLMVQPKLTRDQETYLETLVQLVEVYEQAHHAIDTSDISGLETLRDGLEANGMNASDLARMLGVHASMGSKILRGERSLTWEHACKLGKWFKMDPTAFLDNPPRHHTK